jgi:hypothetical protein
MVLIIILVVLFIICLGLLLTPDDVWCKWGFHQWMYPTYPWWGGIEQGTYCCNLRMKIERTYNKQGKCVKQKRVPFTQEDLDKKATLVKEKEEYDAKVKRYRQLVEDMRSDDECEELLP